MTRVLKLILVVAFLLLDVCVVTPWLLPPTPGTDCAFWSLAIPLITSLIGAVAGKKKGAQDASADMGGETDGGGFDWGAAAPYLAGAGGLVGGMLLNKKKAAPAGSGALDELLNFQKARMMAAEPLNQSGLAMASSMMPSYMKTAGGGVDQWMNTYNAARPGLPPRTPVPGSYQLPGAQWEN
jgi:hypothetical protein